MPNSAPQRSTPMPRASKNKTLPPGCGGRSHASDQTEPDANLYRFYRLEIVPGPFGDWGLVRNWVRIGSSGQLRRDWFETEAEAEDARFELHIAKAKRGYE